jgi:TonB family protein
LIRSAAGRAPGGLSERLEEEWLADLESRPGKMSRLRLAFGCYWAAMVIAQEHRAPNLTAATTTGHKTMSSYARLDGSLIPQRTTAFVVIVGLHVGLILAFASGLASKVVTAVMPPMRVTSVEERPPDPPIPPKSTSEPVLKNFPVIDPGPPVDFKVTPEAPVIQAVVGNSPVMEPVVTHEQLPKPTYRVVGGPGKGFPNPDEYYPPAARRAGEMGTAAVQVCVDSAGRLSSAPTITESSGFARLDEGALKLAKAGSGHYRPSTEDGRPIDSCYAYRIKFQLTDGPDRLRAIQ